MERDQLNVTIESSRIEQPTSQRYKCSSYKCDGCTKDLMLHYIFAFVHPYTDHLLLICTIVKYLFHTRLYLHESHVHRKERWMFERKQTILQLSSWIKSRSHWQMSRITGHFVVLVIRVKYFINPCC